MKRTKKTRNEWLGVWITSGILLVLLLIYLGTALFYCTHFLPGTVINGISVSGDNIKDVKWKMIQETEKYEIKIKARGDKEEILAGVDFGVMPIFDGSLEEELRKQNCFAWPNAFFKESPVKIETMVEFSEQRLEKKVDELEIMDADKMVKPKNARISEFSKKDLYTIIPEEQGTKISRKKFLKCLRRAITNLQDSISLEEEDCYKKPKVTAQSKELKKLVKNLNHYAGARITYQFGKEEEVLDGEQISQWLSVDEQKNVSVSEEQIAAYVNRLADKWDTYGKAKKLKTSYGGRKVKIEGGDYGWKIDREKEKEILTGLVRDGQTTAREPEYEKTANSHGKKDYGNTYVEVNLTAQHLIYYKDGQVVVDSDFVSGDVAKRRETPTGAFGLYYKERNRTLRGQGYASPVSFWMPFNGGVGFHDAKWRGSFGGDYYKWRGSHGCINLPYSAAKTLYENIEAGCAVLVYTLPGTEGEMPQI